MSTNVSANSRIAQFRNFRSDDSAGSSISAWLRLDWRVVLTLVLLAAWGGASRAQAQATAQFSYAQSTIGTGSKNPEGVAVDASGNVYIANFNGGNVLKETLLSDGTYKQTTIGSGWSQPVDVAVDASGNVYVADYGLGKVVKETLSNGTYTASTVDSVSNECIGVAVDASGNVYITEDAILLSQSGEVLKAMPGTGATAGTYTVQTIYTETGFLLGGPAVDASGNVYVAGGGDVRKLAPTGSSTPFTYTESTLFSSVIAPYGVAMDGSGNFYITSNANPGPVVKETLQTNGTYTQSTIVGGLSDPVGVAVDAYGNVYIAVAVGSEVLKEQTAGVNFHTVAVGSTSAAQTLTFTFTNSTAGTIKAPSVVTQGAAGLDFADTKNGTCTTNGTSRTYAAGNTCTVDVTFSPTKAGTRSGAVNLVDGTSGDVIATAYVYGTGQGPQVAFGPAPLSKIFNQDNPNGLAVDASGNVYAAIIDGVAKAVPGTGGAYVVNSFSFTGVGLVSNTTPNDVAVGGDGDLYVSVSSTNSVVKAALQGSFYYSVGTIGSGLSAPEGVAVDASGNVYIADTNNGRVLKETLQPDGTYIQSVVVSGLSSPQGVAVDGSGNVYITDQAGDVLKETLQANGTYAQSTLVSGLNDPYSVAVDASGNVYVTDQGGDLLKETLGSGGTYTQSVLASGLNQPQGLAVDSGGNVYVSEFTYSEVLKEDVSDVPSLTFATAPTVTATQTVTLENIGNAALTLPSLSSAQNPTLTGSSSFTLDGTVGCPVVAASGSAGTLAAGSSCTLPVDFGSQTTGSFSGTLAITDNDLNASSPSYATQTINLSGTVALAKTTTTLSAPSTANYGAPVTLTATVTSTTAGTISGTVTFADRSTTLGTASVNGSGVATFTTSLLNVGAHTLTASYGGNTEYAGSTSAAASLMVNPATTTTSVTASPNPAYSGSVVTLAAAVTSSGGTPTGTVTFLDGSATIGTGTLDSSGKATITTSSLPVGTDSITASYGGSADYKTSVSSALSEVIQQASFTLTISGGSASINPGQNASFPVTVGPEGTLSSPISFQCTASNGNVGCNVTPSSLTLGSSPSSVTLEVQAYGSVSAGLFGGAGNPWNRWGWPLAALGLLPLLGLGLLTRLRLIPQRVQRLAWASVLATGLALGLAACGSPVNATQATPAGTYTVSITGTSGSQTVTKQVSVTVK